MNYVGIRWSKITGRTEYFAGWSTNVSGARYALTTPVRSDALVVSPGAVQGVRNAGFQLRLTESPAGL